LVRWNELVVPLLDDEDFVVFERKTNFAMRESPMGAPKS
jgi:hypothetical protein